MSFLCAQGAIVRGLRCASALVVLGIAGCAVRQPPRPERAALPSPLPSAHYGAAACAASGRVYRLAGDASRVRVFVGKAGALSGAGHEHVIAVDELRGFVQVAEHARRADLAFPLRALKVDPAAVRSALGGHYAEVRLSADERGDTRANMLKSLDARDHPWVHLAIDQGAASAPLHIRLALHGQVQTLSVPATLQISGDRIEASGDLRIRQTDFGIEPFSILLGALRVKDELQIRYRLIFVRWRPAAADCPQ